MKILKQGKLPQEKTSFFYPKKEKHDCGKPVDFDYGSKT